MKLILFVLIFISIDSMADEIKEILSEQPLYAQIAGNCYSHTGTDILTSEYARKNNIKKAVTEPHPLLASSLIQSSLEDGFVSGGTVCDYIEDAKKINTDICSYDGLEAYLNSKAIDNNKAANYYQDKINELDENLSSLVAHISSEELNKKKLDKINEDKDKILQDLCEFKGVALDSKELEEITELSKYIIDQMKNEKKIGAWDKFSEGVTRILSGQKMSDIKVALEVKAKLEKNLKESLAPAILRKFYDRLNSECLVFQKEMNLPSIPQDYFKAFKNLSCKSEIFYQSPITENDTKNIKMRIESQINQGRSVAIGLCGSILDGKSKQDGKLEKNEKGAKRACSKENDTHSVSVIGIVKRDNGKTFYKIKNSWGYNQCDGFNRNLNACRPGGPVKCLDQETEIYCKEGYFYVSESFLQNQLTSISEVNE